MIAGATPIRASVNANVLRGPATAISQAATRPMPPARTWPSTTTMTGRGDSTIARSNVAISRDRAAVASAQALMQLADQRRRQRVAVVRRIQCQPRHLPVDRVLDESAHQ